MLENIVGHARTSRFISVSMLLCVRDYESPLSVHRVYLLKEEGINREARGESEARNSLSKSLSNNSCQFQQIVMPSNRNEPSSSRLFSQLRMLFCFDAPECKLHPSSVPMQVAIPITDRPFGINWAILD